MKDCTKITVKVWGRDDAGRQWANRQSVIATHQMMREDAYISDLKAKMQRRATKELEDQGVTWIDRVDIDQHPYDCGEPFA